MRLADLEPEWILDDGCTSRHIVRTRDPHVRLMGVMFRCPCTQCRGDGCMLAILFANPIGGGLAAPRDALQVGENDGRRWQVVSGDTFETLTIAPSIDASKSGHWHGFIRGGACT